MRNILKWASLAVLFALFSCAKEADLGDLSLVAKPGVYGSVPTLEIVGEPETKATVDAPSMVYRFEVGDRINIWYNTGTTLIYNVSSLIDEGKRAEFTGDGFALKDGETYYSSHPLIRSIADDFKHLTTTYEGQNQTANNDANHIADYSYTYASATCENSHTSFQYHYLCSFFLFKVTLPDALTLTELTISEVTDEAADNFFALDGKVDVTTATFTPAKRSNTMTLKLGSGNQGITVSDKVLFAYLAVAPTNAGKYIVRVKDADKKTYTSSVISQNALAEGQGVWFATTVCEGEDPAVAKIGSKAYSTLEAAFADAVDGDTIKVLADCSGNGIIAPQGKFNETGLTVDFNGHTYTVDGNLVGSTGTETQAFQLLKDNKITFTNGTVYSEKALFLVQNYSNLTLDGMTLTLNNANYAYGYTLSNNNGTTVINNSTINANSAGLFAFDVCRNSSYPSVGVTVTGESVINGNVEVSASGSDAKDGFSLMLETPIAGNLVIDSSAKAAMEATPEKALICKKKEVNQAAPAGFKWVEKDENTDILVVCEYVAQIGETKYETLEDAFAAALDGDEITLLEDCSGNGIKLPENKFTTGITVDFDGHTYDFSGKGVGSANTENNGFQLLQGNKVTFKNGTLTASSEDAGFLIQNYSDLTLVNMTVDGTNVWGGYTLSNNKGNTVINNSKIIAPENGIAFDVCRYSSYPSVSVTVTGAESVITGNVEVSASGNDAKDGFSLMLEAPITGNLVIDPSAAAAMAATPEKALVCKKKTVEQDAPAGFKWETKDETTDMLVACSYVAQIGETKYESLAQAVAAVPADGTPTTITMIANEDIMGNAGVTIATGKNITLDLNGKTVTLKVTESKGSQLITNQGTLTITDSSAGQTGKLTNIADESLAVGSWPTNNYVTNIITNSGTLNVEAGTIQSTANGSICYAVDNNSTSYDAVLNINGGYLTSVGTVVRQFCNSTTKQNVVNVSGGTVETNGSTAMWTQLPGSSATSKKLATLNITGGVIKGSSYAWYDYSYGDSFEAVNYSISGGELYGALYSYAVKDGIKSNFVSGGLFSTSVGAYYIVDGLMCAASEEHTGMYELVPAEVYYYWMDNGQEVGEYYGFSAPFVNEYLCDGEFITLLKNVTLTENIACQLESGSFTLTFGSYNITKGNYSVSLKPGVSVLTDKQTDIFTSAEAGLEVIETALSSGYKYSVASTVAMIGDVEYTTLEAAFAAATDGQTITIVADCAGNGIVAPQGKFATGVTVDFDGHTYTMEGEMVGSTGTQTQAFQLLKDNKVTFKDGTITSSKAKILIQNYSDLTLEGMTLTLNNPNYSSAYTLSNNNGNVVIDGTTINANPAGGFAFDVCRYSSYPSVNVTVTNNSSINGNIEVSASGSDPKEGFSLTIEDGTINGNLVLDQTAANVLASRSDKGVITKANTVTLAVPNENYYWKDNGNDTEILTPYVAKIGSTPYETFAEAFNASNGATIIMLADESVDVTGYAFTIQNGQNVTLDLNGRTLSGVCTSGATSALFRNLGTFTIRDSGSNGSITMSADPYWVYSEADPGGYASNLIRNESELIVEGGTLLNLGTGSACYAIDNYSAGTVTINGGTVDAKKASAIRLFYNNGGKIDVYGGTIGHYTSDEDCSYMGIQVMSGANAVVNVYGGTVVGNYALYSNGSGTSAVNITNGTFDGYVGFAASLPSISISGGVFYCWTGTWGSQTGFITGGTYYEELEPEYIASGYHVVESTIGGETVYIVSPDAQTSSTTQSRPTTIKRSKSRRNISQPQEPRSQYRVR